MADAEAPAVNGSGAADVVVVKEPPSINKLPSAASKAFSEAWDELSESDGPPEVQRRVKALKRLQFEVARTESEYFKEMHDLEMKYASKYTDFFEKRREIVVGKYEPTDAECKPISNEKEAKDNEENANVVNLDESLNKLKLDEKKPEGEEPVKGIPDFWLTIFQNVEMLSEMVQENDVPILKHLTDIKIEMTTKPMGFKIFFHFSPNEHFKNSVLVKTYEMKCEVDAEDPFSFEGPEIIKCEGCDIDWKEGKNITIRVVKKKQKHKQTGSIRMVSKTEELPSFFEFFKPPQHEEGKELDDEEQVKLTSHFEVGQYIRERIVPRAVLYYTGEALEDEDDDDDDEDEEYDEEDDSEDGDNEANASGQSANTDAEEGD